MKRENSILRILAAPAALALLGLSWAALGTAGSEGGRGSEPIELAANPCGAGGNPCAANPCAHANPCGGNPCAAANPCGGGGGIDAKRFRQPDGVRLAAASPRLIERGEELWNDASLGKSGLSCASCHVGQYAQMNASFAAPYPHAVAMPKQMASAAEVNAAEMVNFCMLVPMASEPLAWDSEELAALAAWVEHIRPGYVPTAGATATGNPCGAANPCAAANPRGANPCAVNPCAVNPCAARNPCGR